MDAGRLIGLFISGALGALVGAVFLQSSVRYVLRFRPPFGICWWASFLSFCAAVLANMIALGALRLPQDGSSRKGFAISLVIGFLMQTMVCSSLIKTPEEEPIGFWRAAAVTAVQTAL